MLTNNTTKNAIVFAYGKIDTHVAIFIKCDPILHTNCKRIKTDSFHVSEMFWTLFEKVSLDFVLGCHGIIMLFVWRVGGWRVSRFILGKHIAYSRSFYDLSVLCDIEEVTSN